MQGLNAWLWQRLSGTYLAIFIFYLVFYILFNFPLSFSQWLAWVASPINRIAIGLFFLSLFFHAWIGGRDVILDYIHPPAWRFFSLVVLAISLLAMALWAMQILFWAYAVQGMIQWQ